MDTSHDGCQWLASGLRVGSAISFTITTLLLLSLFNMPLHLSIGTRKGTRTPNPQIRNLLHYPVVLYEHLVSVERLELSRREALDP